MRLGYVSSACCRAAIALSTALLIAGVCDHAQARPAAKKDQADARAKSSPKRKAQPRAIHGPGYAPPYAAIIVDDNSGEVLHEASADEPRHPASLAKIMTLYLLFEQLEGGKIKLDAPLQISSTAATQRPVKLGLKANQTITVEEAIKGLVTRSANDAAVVIAEALGGSEAEFARLMTEKAHALGMTSTLYVNASGLPADEQITTARDQALLGRAIQHRFPVYFKYFSTPSFRFRNADIRNHNNLLGRVQGVDGIKTGYTDASGYNLVSSVHRDQRSVVGVVLGGKSNATRDEKMRELIEQCIPRAAVQRTAPKIMEKPGESTGIAEKATPAAFTPASVSNTPAPVASTGAPAGDIAPVAVTTVSAPKIAPAAMKR